MTEIQSGTRVSIASCHNYYDGPLSGVVTNHWSASSYAYFNMAGYVAEERRAGAVYEIREFTLHELSWSEVAFFFKMKVQFIEQVTANPGWREERKAGRGYYHSDQNQEMDVMIADILTRKPFGYFNDETWIVTAELPTIVDPYQLEADELVTKTRKLLNSEDGDLMACVALLEAWCELMGEDPYEADEEEDDGTE